MNITDLFTRVDKLTVDESKKMMDMKGQDGMALLDVREPEEYKAGHIPGAIFMPLSRLPDDINQLEPSKTVVTYCKRGPRSRSAAALLKRQGFEDVFYMDGGIEAWNGLVASGSFEAGLFLVEGKKTLEELVILAWSLEEGTGVFYARMLDLSTDAEARQVFGSLIRAEQAHKSKLLEAYRHIRGEEIPDETMRSQAVRGYMEGGVLIDDAVDWIREEHASLQDILEISMQLETNSLDLYMKMRMEVEDESAKEIFNVLIEEEKTHLSGLGKLLNNKLKTK